MLRPAARALPCHQVACVPTTCPAPSNRSERRGQSESISLSSSSHNLARSSRALAQRSSNSTALRPSNVGATKRGQSEPSSAVTRSMSSASVASGTHDRGVQAEFAKDQASRRGQHAVAAGDLLGEFGQRRGVHHAAPAACSRRQRNRHTLTRAHRRDCGVDDLVDGRHIGERTVVQSTERRHRGRWNPHGCQAPPRRSRAWPSHRRVPRSS